MTGQWRWFCQSSGTRPAGPGTGWSSGMRVRRRELRTVVVRGGLVAPEPVLLRFEGADQGVAGISGVVPRVLRGRAVAAADVPAVGAPAQVEPPATGGIALHAARSGRRQLRVDRFRRPSGVDPAHC